MSRTPVLVPSIGSAQEGPSNAVLTPSGPIPGECSDGVPPTDTPILFLAAEFDQPDTWYPGFCWQSSLPGQAMKFYIYPWHFGFDPQNPPFGAPPYRGQWRLITNPKVLRFIKENGYAYQLERKK